MAAEEFVEGEVEGIGDNEIKVFAVGGKLAAQQGGQALVLFDGRDGSAALKHGARDCSEAGSDLEDVPAGGGA